jgi:threonine dehydratase
MSHTWNISLFHYRNHGTDHGRVLIGIQVPPQDHAAFQAFLERRGYVYCDESHNTAYQLFLS